MQIKYIQQHVKEKSQNNVSLQICKAIEIDSQGDIGRIVDMPAIIHKHLYNNEAPCQRQHKTDPLRS